MTPAEKSRLEALIAKWDVAQPVNSDRVVADLRHFLSETEETPAGGLKEAIRNAVKLGLTVTIGPKKDKAEADSALRLLREDCKRKDDILRQCRVKLRAMGEGDADAIVVQINSEIGEKQQ